MANPASYMRAMTTSLETRAPTAGFIEKTPLGYAIQVRAACQRRDLGAARAAFRNLADAQLKQLVLRACVRQGVWLF